MPYLAASVSAFGTVEAIPLRDPIVFSAALIGLLCLAAAGAVWTGARRRGVRVKLRIDE